MYNQSCEIVISTPNPNSELIYYSRKIAFDKARKIYPRLLNILQTKNPGKQLRGGFNMDVI